MPRWTRSPGFAPAAADVLFQPADEEDLADFLKAVPKTSRSWSLASARTSWCAKAAFGASSCGFRPRDLARRSDFGDAHPRRRGLPDKRVAALALEAGIGGFHFYHGIPGAIGGALRMNAGANGVETRERVVEVRALDREGQCARAVERRHGLCLPALVGAERPDLHLGCFRRLSRNSARIKRCDGRGAASPRDGAADPREDRRLDLQEPEGTSAWKEIDKAGCRGLMIGGAQMSPDALQLHDQCWQRHRLRS
jgi:UDP-N-acetylmuramate dehydrogenase